MSSIETRKLERQKQRETRVPLGVPRAKLGAPEIPGFHLHWLNDEPGRIPAAIEGGYEHVYESELKGQANNQDLGEKVSRIVGRNEDGSSLRAYLMKIKLEWYEADQRTKRKELDAIDNAIRQGKMNEQPDDKRYVPREGISVSSKVDKPE